ncbi:MAG: hypothetical protein VXW17_01920 [Pseudomonadota bacterium]|nr:hypothetical protein [Pseudomonadota bacterium]
MADTKPRPANVPEENEYHTIHWLVVVTYAAAIAGVSMLIMNAG